MADDVTFRPATARDFETFYGRPAPQTVRALVAVKDGEVIGLGGYWLRDGDAVAFSDIKPEFRKRPKEILKAARLLVGYLREKGIPMVAEASPHEKNSPRMLRWAGFEQIEGSLYRMTE